MPNAERVSPVTFSHHVAVRTLSLCAAIRRPGRCRHVRIAFSEAAQ
jgi:hypothetical protein